MSDSYIVKRTTSIPTNWREGRRLRAWELKQKGWKQCDIAAALGVTEGAVSQWLRRAREDGVEKLRPAIRSGAPSRLTQEHRAALLEMLSRGAEAFGFKDLVWTGPRVAQLIEQYFGISYHPNYVLYLLKTLGWKQKSRSSKHGRKTR